MQKGNSGANLFFERMGHENARMAELSGVPLDRITTRTCINSVRRPRDPSAGGADRWSRNYGATLNESIDAYWPVFSLITDGDTFELERLKKL